MWRRLPGALLLLLCACQGPAAAPESPEAPEAEPNVDPHEALFAQAAAAEQAGDLQTAAARYRQALVHPPNNPFEHLAVARVLEKQGNLVEAMAAVQEGLVAFEGDDDLRLRQARLMGLLGEPVAGLTQIESLVEADPYGLEARFAKVELLLQMGRHDEAVAVANAVVGEMPDEPYAQLWLGRAQLKAGSREAARKSAALGLELAGDCACTADARDALTALAQAAGAPPP